VERKHLQSLLATLVGVMLLAAAAHGQRPQHGKLFPPENLQQLEIPDRDVWQRPDHIMDALGIAEGSVVADLGAGSGWFTIRLARRVRPTGKVYAEDIQPQMIEVIKRRVARENLQRTVEFKLGTAEDLRLPENALDAALIVDAYHEMDQPVQLLRSAARALKQDGRIGIVEFTKSGGGPGPPMEERVDPDRVIREAKAAGLRLIAQPNILRYQYMLVFGKPEQTALRSR
jgi:ubiquinone/menaquinone biosynthesis C-methylase UbiE